MIWGFVPLAMVWLRTAESHRALPVGQAGIAQTSPPSDDAEVRPAAGDDLEVDMDERHLLISKYLRHIDEKKWNRLLQDSISQGWDGDTLHFPLRGEVFLDGGWTPVVQKDWKYMYRALKQGKTAFQIKSRRQKYNISVLSRAEGKQVNAASGKIRHLRFVYADSVEIADAAPKRTTAAVMCVKGGVGRRGSKFKLNEDDDYQAYFACHDDKGSGIDICFYRKITPELHLCRNSVGNLNNYQVESTGEITIPFYRALQGSRSILSGTLIENATRFHDDMFSLTDTDPSGKETTRSYSVLA